MYPSINLSWNYVSINSFLTTLIWSLLFFTPKTHGGAEGRWWKDNILQWTTTTSCSAAQIETSSSLFFPFYSTNIFRMYMSNTFLISQKCAQWSLIKWAFNCMSRNQYWSPGSELLQWCSACVLQKGAVWLLFRSLLFHRRLSVYLSNQIIKDLIHTKTILLLDNCHYIYSMYLRS